MKIFLAVMVGVNLYCGYMPTETNSVDVISMLNFATASFCAFGLGISFK